MFAQNAGNPPPRPYTRGTESPRNSHGGTTQQTGGRSVDASPPAGSLPQAAPPSKSRLTAHWAAVRVPLMRRVAQGLWVVAAVAPTVALGLVPAAIFWCPAWSWPVLAVGVGLALLTTMAVCLYLIAFLDRASSGRPADKDMQQHEQVLQKKSSNLPGNVPQVGPTLPRGATYFGVKVAGLEPAAVPQRPGLQADRLNADTAGIDGEQRGMRGYLPCAAYARSEATPYDRSQLHQVANLSPDGISFSDVRIRGRGRYTDLAVSTLMDNLAIFTYDLFGRRAFGEWLGGFYVGGWSNSFLMLGGELGVVHAALGAGARVNGNSNYRSELKQGLRDNRDRGVAAITDASEALGHYAIEKKATQVTGWACTPALTWTQGLFAPARAFWRQDNRSITRSDATLAVNLAQAGEHAGKAAEAVGKQDKLFAARDLAHPEALLPKDTCGTMREFYRGSLKTGSLLTTFVGHHAMAHGHCALNVTCAETALVDGQLLPQLEVTFTQRHQQGTRWLASLAGGVGADVGSRTFDDTRYVAQVPGKASLAQPLELLLAALRGSDDRKLQSDAWAEFVANQKARVRREVSHGRIWGRQAGYDGLPAGHTYLEALPSRVRLRLPSGFGEGLVGFVRGHAEIATTVYEESENLKEEAVARVVHGSWCQPSGSTNGPAGSRTPHVTSELACEEAGQPHLYLSSRWSMTHADANEVTDYILKPLRETLGLGSTGAGEGFLVPEGWQKSPVATWRVSREVKLESGFGHQELALLGQASAADWRAVGGWPAGSSAADGEALSLALKGQLGALSRAGLDPEDAAWRGLGAATAAFVLKTQLAAPALLRRVVAHLRLAGTGGLPAVTDLAGAGGWRLTTQSSAYNRPVQYLKEFRCEAEQLEAKGRQDFVDRVHAEERETWAAILLAAEDPFLDDADRQAHTVRLREVQADLRALRHAHAPTAAQG